MQPQHVKVQRLCTRQWSGTADEIDAIGTKRYEAQSGGEREIQRTMLELLNQLDGFDSMGDVKVCIPPVVQLDKCLEALIHRRLCVAHH